jgi:hypothetical protein
MKILKPAAPHANLVVGAEMQKYLEVFNAVKADREYGLQWQHKLSMKTGEGLGAALLKVLRPSWTTDSPDLLLNSNGLFFSIWVDEACEAKGIARYNLHAKKLRAIKGEQFAAREFVRAFRAQCGDELRGWPNWTYPKGPITLFEGEFPLDIETLHAKSSDLITRFVTLTPMLDKLLAEA